MTAITVYADVDDAQSIATIDAMRGAHLVFALVSRSDQPVATEEARVTNFPTVVALTETASIRWIGHRIDLVALLVDLIRESPMPARGLDNLEAVCNIVVTKGQAVDQIRRHDASPLEFFTECGEQPLYRAGTVLDWLGY